MLISGYNMECLVDWDEELRLQKEKRKEEELQEQKRCQQLRLKIEEIICKIFSNDELKEIQPYKEAIFSYLKDNGKLDLVNNISSLSACINIYYRMLKGENVGLDEYVFLQSSSRTSENEIAREIAKQYSISNEILISMATEKCIEQGGSYDDNDSINEIIDEMFKNFKSENLENLSNDELNNAIRTMIYLHSNTNLNLSPYLKSKRMTLMRRK